jgi:hypothetical protein
VLPSLTTSARRLPRRRVLAGIASLVLFGCALVAPTLTPAAPVEPPPSLSARLPSSSWGLAIPTSWFAAPPADLRIGDRIDILAMRSSERPTANAIAFDLEVMSVDERTVVLGVSAFDASAIAVARAAGQLIVPLVRSTQ